MSICLYKYVYIFMHVHTSSVTELNKTILHTKSIVRVSIHI